MAQAKVKKVAKSKPQTEAKQETRPKRELVDDIDAMLEEIDAVLEDVAGGETSEYAQEFVKNYVQKGGQ